MWLLLFFFSLLFFFFFRFTLVLPSTDDSPFRRSFVFHFNFSSISILRSKWLFFKRYRSYTKNIGILFEQFLSHFPINFPSASFTHSSLPFTLSLFTFPTLRFDVNFKAIFAHSFPSFAPVSKKKKKYPFSSVVRSLSSSFLFRSSQFPLAPSPSPTLPHCFHGTTWLEQATGSDATHREISR